MLPTVTLMWGCLWWGVPIQTEDWTHREYGRRASSVPLLCTRTYCLPHLAVQVGDLLPCCVVKAGETLLLTICLAGSWKPLLFYVSCVLPLDHFTWSPILGKPGQLQSLYFLVYEEKGALCCGKTSAGDVPGMFHFFCKAIVTVFVGRLLKNWALSCLQVTYNCKSYKVACRES